MDKQQQETVAAFTQQLAAQIGKDPTKLKVEQGVASMLERMQEGFIVDLHIEGTRRFWKRLTVEDLGLAMEGDSTVIYGSEATDVLTNYFQLGRLSLLPSNKQLAKLLESEQEQFVSQEQLATLERSARYCLARYGFKSHWGWFIPVTVYKQWQEEHAKYEAEFIALRERLLANYDQIVNFVVEAYRPLALDAWRMLAVNKSLFRPGREETISDTVIREVVTLLAAGQGRETFVANYLDCIRQAIRSKNSVERSFRFEVELSVIPLPSLLAKDLEHTDRLYAERAIRDAQIQAELERIEADRRLSQQKVLTAEQEERERRYLALQAERERSQLQLAMEREIIANAQRDKERLLGEFYREVTGQINDQLQAVCLSVLENIETHEGTLRGPVSQQLRNLVTQLESLNFMGDQEIVDMLSQIREALPSQEERQEAAKGMAKIDTTRLQTVLRKVGNQAKEIVIDLGMSPSQRRVRSDEALSEGLLTVETRKPRRGEIALPTQQSGTGRKKRKESAIS